MTTIGGSAALTVPISGIVTWKSDSTLEQKGLEGLVGAVDLIDQQHRRPLGRGLDRLQERARLMR